MWKHQAFCARDLDQQVFLELRLIEDDFVRRIFQQHICWIEFKYYCTHKQCWLELGMCLTPAHGIVTSKTNNNRSSLVISSDDPRSSFKTVIVNSIFIKFMIYIYNSRIQPGSFSPSFILAWFQTVARNEKHCCFLCASQSQQNILLLVFIVACSFLLLSYHQTCWVSFAKSCHFCRV